MKLTFNKILITRSGVKLLSKNMAVKCATIENKKVINSDEKFQINVWNLRERVNMVPSFLLLLCKLPVSAKKKSRKKKIETSVKFMPCTMLAIIIWQFTVYPFQFDSPQVKRDLISSIINFLHELQNALIDLRKLGSNRKILKIRRETD